MPSILIVEKNGTIKSLNAKNLTSDDLYKKAGFKTNTDFEHQTTWNVDLNGKHYSISLYGKKTGRANQENKYEFPPPVDSILYFGNCVLVNMQNDNYEDLSVSDWEKVYEHLYGGFEDLDNSEDSSSEEDEDIKAMPKTKSGYVMDDFIVDDDAEESSEYEDTESGSENTPPPPPKKQPVKKSATTKSSSASTPATAPPKKEKTKEAPKPPEEEYFGCTSELSEEEYV